MVLGSFEMSYHLSTNVICDGPRSVTSLFVPKVDVKECFTLTRPGDPTGPVTDGHLLLTGKLAKVKLRYATQGSTVLAEQSNAMHLNSMFSDFFFPHGNARYFCTSDDTHVYAFVPDTPLQPVKRATDQELQCWLRSNAGQICRTQDCRCHKNWFEGEFYCLLVGTLRYRGGWRGQVDLLYFWLMLKPSERPDSTGAFERFGIGWHQWVAIEASNFRLFEGAEEQTVKVI
jgi:hypothetical protein